MKINDAENSIEKQYNEELEILNDNNKRMREVNSYYFKMRESHNTRKKSEESETETEDDPVKDLNNEKERERMKEKELASAENKENVPMVQ